MLLKRLELHGFKSFAKKAVFDFTHPITAVVGPNGSGKSNVVEALRFVLGEQSSKSLRSKSGADLVFIGSKSLPRGTKARVMATFDNTARQMRLTDDNGQMVAVDTDEVTIGREVGSDGANKYSINGSDVRLRDVHELISGLNIGSSGHHIISQGEADRLLFSKPAERREMLEEALGLRMYHYRLRDAERKLEKTIQHEAEAEAARRELMPEMRSLKAHVERMERAQELRLELGAHAAKYQYMMGQYLSHHDRHLATLEQNLDAQFAALPTDSIDSGDSVVSAELRQAESAVASARSVASERASVLDQLARAQARLDGTIEALESHAAEPARKTPMVSLPSVQTLQEDIASSFQTLPDPVSHADVKRAIAGTFETFTSQYADHVAPVADNSERIAGLRAELEVISSQRATAELERAESERLVQAALDRLQQVHESTRASERHQFESRAVRMQLENQKQQLVRERNELRAAYDLFVEDIREVEALTGTLPESDFVSAEAPDQQILRTERQQLERLKLRLEELGGGGGSDIMDTYNEVRERIDHLAKELEDIKVAREQLEQLGVQIRAELYEGFQKGLKHVATSFREHFQRMFGGGDVTLTLVPIKKRAADSEDLPAQAGEAEETETSHGIDIGVTLPRKRVSDLSLLSGGERSLISIALLFALTSVNPPPFLVLDETDAALDEANSRLYGNLLEHLAEQTQLIVVTHNRETMARAGVLYGVTLGGDDASTLLSVKFEEATQFAK
jgi:chromosome segregation protein